MLDHYHLLKRSAGGVESIDLHELLGENRTLRLCAVVVLWLGLPI